jgi:hypothetical protein
MWLPRWLKNERQRAIVALLGGGAASIIAAAWAVFLYINRDMGKVEATYHVCVGQKAENCPSGSVFVPCYSSVAEWATKECESYTAKRILSRSGGMCGYEVVEIKCTANR